MTVHEELTEGTGEEMQRRTAVRVIHRKPNASTDRSAPRLVDLDEYMAILPSAIEKAFLWLDFEEEDPFERHGDVGVVTIDGPLMQRGGWWFDGYEAIRGRFEAALNDKDTKSVVLKINSPGGVCAGCFSAVRAMRAMKVAANKPVIAYADESAYSAAYAMACIADEIYLPREGGLGSIGVIGSLEDWTGFNEQMGIKVAVITSGAQKADGDPDVPLTQAVVDRYQARINELAGFFAEAVSEARGLTVEQILGYEAGVFYGANAVKNQLADGVTTFEDVIEKAKKMGASRARATGSAGATKTRAGSAAQETTMSDTTTDTTASFAEFALACGLPHDASKGDVLAKMAKDKAATEKALDTLRTDRIQIEQVIAATGATTLDGALGAIAAGKSAVDALSAATAKTEALERAQLITDAKAAHKLTPAQEKGLEGKSLDFVRSFLELQHPNPVLAAKGDTEVERTDGSLSYKGKTWAEMTPGEMHALYIDNHDLYVAMRDAAAKA